MCAAEQDFDFINQKTLDRSGRPRGPGRTVSHGRVIDKVLSKQVQIVDSSGQTYIIQGGNQDIMDAIQGNYRIVLVFGGRTNRSSIKRSLKSAEPWVNFKIS